MNILLCTSLPFVPAALAHQLIPEGINVISLSTPDEIQKAMPQIGKVCFLDDTLLNKMELIRLVSDIKKEEPTCKFVVFSQNSDVTVLQMFIRMGFDGVLPASLPPEIMAEKALEFIQKYCSQIEQRRFIRIKTDNTEETHIKIKNPQFIEGKITDVSMGGIAAFFNQQPLPVKEEQVIKKAEIMLDGKSIFADMKLIKQKMPIAAFTFHQMEEEEKASLAEYIYYKTFLSFNHKKNI